MLVIWSDTRTGQRKLHAQQFDANGNAEWQDGGVIAATNSWNMREPVTVTCAGNGIWVIAWHDYCNNPESPDQCDLYAQKHGQ